MRTLNRIAVLVPNQPPWIGSVQLVLPATILQSKTLAANLQSTYPRKPTTETVTRLARICDQIFEEKNSTLGITRQWSGQRTEAWKHLGDGSPTLFSP